MSQLPFFYEKVYVIMMILLQGSGRVAVKENRYVLKILLFSQQSVLVT